MSALDTYGAKLFDKYFAHYITDMTPFTFEYDHSLLARWLLKLSYNSARMAGSDHQRLARYAPALRDHSLPLPSDFSIAVDLVLPSEFPEPYPTLYPASNRLCAVQVSDASDDWCTIRLVAINSYYFLIIIQDMPDEEVDPQHALAVLSLIRGIGLDPLASSVLLQPSGATMLQMHSDLADAIYSRDQTNPDWKRPGRP